MSNPTQTCCCSSPECRAHGCAILRTGAARKGMSATEDARSRFARLNPSERWQHLLILLDRNADVPAYVVQWLLAVTASQKVHGLASMPRAEEEPYDPTI